jgi:hypothetical protein
VTHDEVVERWGLEPHPEGGFYRRTYASPLTATPPGWSGTRALATAILYLLPAGEQAAWHRVRSEELWLWQGGGPMLLQVEDRAHVVGPGATEGEELHVLVPASAWQTARPATDRWSLVACVVVPGFDWADHEMRP